MDLSTLAAIFLKLGVLGFGGPAAHIALMRDEFVEKRSVISEQEFLDLVSAVNFIPGPNSTELAIHLGHRVAGTPGLLIAGVSFILPAFCLVLLFAVFYQAIDAVSWIEPVVAGVRPVMIAIIFHALLKFRTMALKKTNHYLLAGLVFLGLSFHVNELILLFVAGLLASRKRLYSLAPLGIIPVTTSIGTGNLFLIFLKIGSVLFGSGYVLIAFLKSELVDQRRWLTDGQLLDAVTVGQVTPGPVFTTATFIGYQLQGFSGAVIATLGIFFPAFVFVLLSLPLLPKLRASEKISAALDGVNSASFSLMGFVLLSLMKTHLSTIPAAVISSAAFFILHFTRINSAFLILLGGLVGYFFL